ncbi:MAG: DUF1127 domain-containing protein [Marivibrio sp.]|uniref:DUF1127 domain-containing protein n=1 Tax=Marivibrio sp. TaxID=2039719 RepID=UPI0032EFE9FF
MHALTKNSYALSRPASRSGLIATLRLWQARVEDRARLRDAPAALLADIGVTRADAEREAAKPFWRA